MTEAAVQHIRCRLAGERIALPLRSSARCDAGPSLPEDYRKSAGQTSLCITTHQDDTHYQPVFLRSGNEPALQHDAQGRSTQT
jgi:hypothetical protein